MKRLNVLITVMYNQRVYSTTLSLNIYVYQCVWKNHNRYIFMVPKMKVLEEQQQQELLLF